jgi:periplasmic protein TonB
MKKTFIPLLTILIIPLISCSRLIGQNATVINLSCDSIRNKNRVFNVYEIMPEYPGGQEKMKIFINDNINFPTEQDKLAKDLFVVFQINTIGHIEEICVYKDVEKINSTPLGIEVIRVFRLMPDWNPAEENGVPKSVTFTLRINIEKQN